MNKIKFLIYVLLALFIMTGTTVLADTDTPQDFNISIPTIMYHKISDNPVEWNDYCISSEQLRGDFEEIRKAGFTPISVSEFITLSNEYKNLQMSYGKDKNVKLQNFKLLLQKTPNPLLITFDDGYADGFTILYPMLKEFGFKANISVVGYYTEKAQGFISGDQIKQMYESGLVEFGNHTYSLHDMEYSQLKTFINTPKNYEAVKSDYIKNSVLITKYTGSLPAFFTYPYGISSAFSETALNEMGEKVSFVTNASPNFFKLSNNLRKISRLNRVHNISSEEFVLSIIEKMKQQNPIAFDKNHFSLEQYQLVTKNKLLNLEYNVLITNNDEDISLKAINVNSVAMIDISDLASCKGISVQNCNYAGICKINMFGEALIFNKLNGGLLWREKETIVPLVNPEMLPVRAVFEHLGYTVDYIKTNDTIKIYK